MGRTRGGGGVSQGPPPPPKEKKNDAGYAVFYEKRDPDAKIMGRNSTKVLAMGTATYTKQNWCRSRDSRWGDIKMGITKSGSDNQEEGFARRNR